MRIKLENVNFIYQRKFVEAAPVLQDVSLTVAAGEFVALLGQGGSGKSTLAQLMAGLLTPTSGNIYRESAEPGAGDTGRVGLVFQYPEQQFFAETVAEEVGFAAKNRGLDETAVAKVVAKALAQVGLEAEAFAARDPFALSGGQQRRVAIAGVMALEPQVLIFDEASAGLDAAGRRWLYQLARCQHDAGKTIIWITHDMDEAALLAQRIVVLQAGRVAADLPPQALFYDRELLAQVGLAQPRVPHLVQELQRRGWPLAGRALSPEAAAQEIAAAKAEVSEA